tara:strand:+ start:3117 stop:5468 length:2352 start_codon:yes stop_codon:yes gene_type:complete
MIGKPNLLEAEDIVKSLPDMQLMQVVQNPSGDIPQFLAVSEIQRRTKMRKDYEAQMADVPQATVSEQVVQEGIAGLMSPAMPAQMQMTPQMSPQMPQQAMPVQMPTMQPEMRMAQGGVVRMQNMGQVPTLRELRSLYPNLTREELYELARSQGIDVPFALSDAIRNINLPDVSLPDINLLPDYTEFYDLRDRSEGLDQREVYERARELGIDSPQPAYTQVRDLASDIGSAVSGGVESVRELPGDIGSGIASLTSRGKDYLKDALPSMPDVSISDIRRLIPDSIADTEFENTFARITSDTPYADYFRNALKNLRQGLPEIPSEGVTLPELYQSGAMMPLSMEGLGRAGESVASTAKDVGGSIYDSVAGGVRSAVDPLSEYLGEKGRTISRDFEKGTARGIGSLIGEVGQIPFEYYGSLARGGRELGASGRRVVGDFAKGLLGLGSDDDIPGDARVQALKSVEKQARPKAETILGRIEKADILEINPDLRIPTLPSMLTTPGEIEPVTPDLSPDAVAAREAKLIEMEAKRKTLEGEGKKEPATSKVKTTGKTSGDVARESYEDKLLELLGKQTKVPSYDDIIKETKDEALSSALIALGSGIASGDIGAGIRTAGEAALAQKQKARELAREQKIAQAEAKRGDISRQIEGVSALAQLQSKKDLLREELAQQEMLKTLGFDVEKELAKERRTLDRELEQNKDIRSQRNFVADQLALVTDRMDRLLATGREDEPEYARLGIRLKTLQERADKLKTPQESDKELKKLLKTLQERADISDVDYTGYFVNK